MAKELAGLDKEKLKKYWAENIRLTSIIMVIWFVVTYVAIFFAPAVEQHRDLRVPHGLLHGRTGIADHLRDPDLLVRLQDEQGGQRIRR